MDRSDINCLKLRLDAFAGSQLSIRRDQRARSKGSALPIRRPPGRDNYEPERLSSCGQSWRSCDQRRPGWLPHLHPRHRLSGNLRVEHQVALTTMPERLRNCSMIEMGSDRVARSGWLIMHTLVAYVAHLFESGWRSAIRKSSKPNNGLRTGEVVHEKRGFEQ